MKISPASVLCVLFCLALVNSEVREITENELPEIQSSNKIWLVYQGNDENQIKILEKV